jgi:hypothetical protein
MTIDDLQALLSDPAAFRRAFRKAELVALLKDQFRQGRTPYIHQVTLPNGSQIRLKFVNTIKKLFNSKNVELIGKESYLSYYEVTVAPIGQKAYCFTLDVSQIVWGTAKSRATLKHAQVIEALTMIGAEFGIDLSDPVKWSTTYSEIY